MQVSGDGATATGGVTVRADGTVTKAEYATMRGRHPSAVSHWIAKGLLKPPALVGTGRSARINVALADQQLAGVLDVGQQLAQAQPLLPDSVPVAAPAPTPAADPSFPQEPRDDSSQQRLMRARAEREELELQRARAQAAEDEGRWLDARLAAEAWAAELGSIWRSIESWLLTEVPQEIASLDTRDHRNISAALKASFRRLRERIAEGASQPAAQNDDPGEGDDLIEDEEAAEE